MTKAHASIASTQRQPAPTLEDLVPDLRLGERAQIDELTQMLSFKRPAHSSTEQAWVEQFIDPLLTHQNATHSCVDDYGNRWVLVGEVDTHVMFTAHTDSVHTLQGHQTVARVGRFLVLSDEKSNCLGADDATGCWIMKRMIEAGVPGLYAFFRAEEVGCQGSRWALDNRPDLIKHIQACVSFDRRGTSSVITHQSWGRCCSDEFAMALAEALCTDELLYAPDDTGIFTDSATFMSTIAECTNISTGYDYEHSADESQDLVHLVHLTRRILQVDWQALPIEREPQSEPDYGRASGFEWRGADRYDMPTITDYTEAQLYEMDFNDLVELVADTDPIELADLISELAGKLRRAQHEYH